jgi:hypothetical protein
MGAGAGLLLVAAAALVAGTFAYAQQMPTGPAAREVEALACAPRAVRVLPPRPGVVTGAVEPQKNMYATGDTLIIKAIAEGALVVGQQYYVRRTLPPNDRGADVKNPWINVHTAGWIRIESIEGDHALASVTYVCDAIDPDDYLAPFEVPVIPEPLQGEGAADFASPALVLFGTDRRAAHGGGSYVAIDRGADSGLRPGQHITFFRHEGVSEGDPGSRVVLGEGLVIEVGAESATALVTTATQPIYSGDSVAFWR